MLVLLTAALLSASNAITALPASQTPPPLAPLPPAVVAPAIVPPPDPARLAVATRIAARVVPDGSYRTMMDGLMGNVQQGMLQNLMAMPVREFAKAAGVPDAKVVALGTGTLHDVLAILDPSFDERMRLTTAATNRLLIDALTGIEPTMREGMAIAYANHFTATQLADIDAFFASPSGEVYAAANLRLMNDPALVTRMQGMMKTIATRMPVLAKDAAAATAALPPPRKYADLTAADKAKLAALLGIDPATLK